MWNLSTIENVLKARNSKIDLRVQGFSIDSRTLKEGQVFIALRGDNFNGNEFVEDAFEKGAVACIVDDASIKNEFSDRNIILVADTFKALRELAKYSRSHRLKGKVIGITGSVGKTTTKEMLSHVLSSIGKTEASYGNYNNHYGVPLTLINFSSDSKFYIVEMGMNHAGEIASLTKLSKPDIAIITNIAPAHIEFFKDLEAIADAKAEIMEGLSKGSDIVLNSNSQYFDKLKNIAESKQLKVISFSGTDSNVYLKTKAGSTYTVSINNRELKYHMQDISEHLATNSLAVIAVLSALKVDIASALTSLGNFSPQSGRGQVYRLANNIQLIDESYNASPMATKAALKDLARRKAGGRAIAILGDMKELGEDSIKYHRELANVITEVNVDYVVTVGELMQELAKALPKSKVLLSAKASSELVDLNKILKPNDIILVKGSFSMDMATIVNTIKDIYA